MKRQSDIFGVNREQDDVETQTRRVKDGESQKDVERNKVPAKALVKEDVQALIKRALTDQKLPLEDPTKARCLKNAQNFESSFSEKIEKVDSPRRLSIPKLRIYDGTSNLANHVQYFQHSMACG